MTVGKLPSRQEILDFLQTANRETGKREIARAFGIKGGDRIALKELLRDMANDGLITGSRRKLTRPGVLPSVTVIEIVARDPDGEFVGRPGTWDEEHGPAPRIVMAESKRGTGPVAGIGDRVLARITPLGADADYPYQARTIKRLARATQRLLGIFRALPGGTGVIDPVDRKQLKAGEARIDSLKAQLAKDRKAHDTAAIKQDEKALNDAREAQERELDRMKREDARLKAVEAKVRKERDAVGDTRSDLKQERSSVRSGDLRQDQRQFARDTVTLDKDKARRDSVQDALARDRTRTKAIEARIDSLRTQLAKDRKASDTAAIKQDEAALDAAQKAHTNALDQQQREVALLKQVDAKTRKQADTTNDVHRDIKHDRSAERAHSTQASSRRR